MADHPLRDLADQIAAHVAADDSHAVLKHLDRAGAKKSGVDLGIHTAADMRRAVSDMLMDRETVAFQAQDNGKSYFFNGRKNLLAIVDPLNKSGDGGTIMRAKTAHQGKVYFRDKVYGEWADKMGVKPVTKIGGLAGLIERNPALEGALRDVYSREGKIPVAPENVAASVKVVPSADAPIEKMQARVQDIIRKEIPAPTYDLSEIVNGVSDELGPEGRPKNAVHALAKNPGLLALIESEAGARKFGYINVGDNALVLSFDNEKNQRRILRITSATEGAFPHTSNVLHPLSEASIAGLLVQTMEPAISLDTFLDNKNRVRDGLINHAVISKDESVLVRGRLQEALYKDGLFLYDDHAGNYAMTAEGRLVSPDPGAVRTLAEQCAFIEKQPPHLQQYLNEQLSEIEHKASAHDTVKTPHVASSAFAKAANTHGGRAQIVADAAVHLAKGDVAGAAIIASTGAAIEAATSEKGIETGLKLAGKIFKGASFFARRIPLVGAVVTGGFVLYEAGKNAINGDIGKAGAALAAGAAETAGNILGFGAGDAAREAVRSTIIATAGEEYAVDKSGLRTLGESAYELVTSPSRLDEIKGMPTADFKIASSAARQAPQMVVAQTYEAPGVG